MTGKPEIAIFCMLVALFLMFLFLLIEHKPCPDRLRLERSNCRDYDCSYMSTIQVGDISVPMYIAQTCQTCDETCVE